MIDFEELTRNQEAAVERMLHEDSDKGALLAFDVGLGKTRTGLMAAKALGERVVLVVIPLPTIPSWTKAVAEEYPELPVFELNSKAAGRKALANFSWRVPGVYLITHEYWERLAWEKQVVKKRRASDPERTRKVASDTWSGAGFMLIFDESHRSANVESWTHKALRNIDPEVFKLSMSGTFAGDKFDGAYGAAKWIWPHRTDILPDDIFSWRNMWARVKYHKFKPRNQEVVGEKDEGAFVSSLPCYIRMESPLPPATTHTVWLDLYEEQRRVYDELDNRMVAWIEGNPLVTEVSVAKRVRQRQATLAMPSLRFDEDTGELLEVFFEKGAESSKVDRLISAIEDPNDPDLGDILAGEQLLILTDSQLFARELVDRLNEKFGEGKAKEWSGKVTRTKRAPIIGEFQRREIEYLVGVQSAMGTGTDGLQYSAARTVVFMSLADRRIDNEQGIGRLNRTGQTKPVRAVYFLARDTIDTGQQSKQVQDALKMKKIMRAKLARENGEA